jgi:hypothetical protein
MTVTYRATGDSISSEVAVRAGDLVRQGYH